MCRHLAYLGPPRTLGALLCDRPHGLFRQSWAPRNQAHGTVNADGFGVGWYADGDPVPARYRRGRPIWADQSFVDLARVVRSHAVLAAVRSATPGQAAGEAAAAPFTQGEWLFSHNGRLFDWPDSGRALTADLPASALLEVEALTDSGVLWALVRARLGRGMPADAAVADAGARVRQVAGGRLNMLLTDGRRIVATADGDTLAYRCRSGEVEVASEPSDDEPGWVHVPERSLIVAVPGHVQVTPLRTSSSERTETP